MRRIQETEDRREKAWGRPFDFAQGRGKDHYVRGASRFAGFE